MSKVKEKIVKQGKVNGMDSIEIIGAFDFNSSEVDAIADKIINGGGQNIAFNFKQTAYITSIGIACIMKVMKKLQKIGSKLYVYGATDDMVELLKITRLSYFIIFI